MEQGPDAVGGDGVQQPVLVHGGQAVFLQKIGHFLCSEGCGGVDDDDPGDARGAGEQVNCRHRLGSYPGQ